MSDIKLENLEIDGYHIYQDKDSFNFGIDAVLLANFAIKEFNGQIGHTSAELNKQFNFREPRKTSFFECVPVRTSNSSHFLKTSFQKCSFLEVPFINICDFCSGSIPIPLIIYAKRNKFLNSNIKISAFEIDSDQVDIAKKSIEWNKKNILDAKNIGLDICLFNDDIKNIFLDKNKYKKYYETFDIITVNPPYIKKGSGILNLNDKKLLAKHEILITFEEICKAASLFLKSNKKFYIVHQSSRLTEINITLKKYLFEIKKIQFIHPNIDKQSTLCLIEAVKNAKPGVKILDPIIIYDEKGQISKKISTIYGK